MLEYYVQKRRENVHQSKLKQAIEYIIEATKHHFIIVRERPIFLILDSLLY